MASTTLWMNIIEYPPSSQDTSLRFECKPIDGSSRAELGSELGILLGNTVQFIHPDPTSFCSVEMGHFLAPSITEGENSSGNRKQL